MNIIKISTVLKREFSDYFDIKGYKTQSLEQFVVRRYALNNQKITINKEK